MKKNYLIILTAIFTVFSQTHLVAQQWVVNQVIVGSGGTFGDTTNFVTIASYSPTSGNTTIFDTIYTQSIQNVIIENEIAFVAAQDSIISYNLNTYNRIAAVEAPGIHNLAVSEEILVASFWYPLTSGFVKIYSAPDLTLITTINEVSDEADGILIFPWIPSAVVAIPGGWNSTSGKLAWIDLENNVLLGESDMGNLGNGVSFFVSYMIDIPRHLAFTKTPWGDSTFSMYGFDVTGHATESYVFNAVLDGYTGLDNEIMYAQINGGIGQLDLENNELNHNLLIDMPTLPIASSVFDSINKQFYVATTDFASIGIGTIYDQNGDIIGSFDAEISPEALAIDYRQDTGIYDLFTESKIKVYPNPSSKVITIEVDGGLSPDSFKVVDINGRVIMDESFTNEAAIVDISILEAGLYFLILSNSDEVLTSSFVKK